MIGKGVASLIGGILLFVGCEVGTIFAGKFVKAGAVALKAGVGAAKGARVAIDAAQSVEAATETIGAVTDAVN